MWQDDLGDEFWHHGQVCYT